MIIFKPNSLYTRNIQLKRVKGSQSEPLFLMVGLLLSENDIIRIYLIYLKVLYHIFNWR